MLTALRYWSTGAQKWEAKRYDKPWSRFIYSSLFNRMDYLAFLIEQMPDGAHVVELGCGSGRLFGLLKDKKRLKYSGYDICPTAIQEARSRWSDYPNATWNCCQITDIPPLSCDLAVSAGLLDWLNDEQIKFGINRIDTPYFAHSFSKKKKTAGVYIHIAFTYIQSILNKSKYDPRKFTFTEIRNLFYKSQSLSFIENKMLSFGCFVLYLPTPFESDFNQFRIKRYFENKGQNVSSTERLVKSAEVSEVKKHLPLLNGMNVLEVGSGTGTYSQLLLDSGVRSLIALDNHVDTTAFVKDARFHFFLKSSEALKSEDSFDAVILFGVLEFVSGTAKIISKLASVTAAKGKIFVLYPKDRSLLTFLYRKYHELGGRRLNCLSTENLRAVFERNGFAQVSRSSAGPVNDLLVFEKTR